MATTYHKNPCPGGHKIYNFDRPFLGNRYVILSLSELCLEVEKKIFIRNNAVSLYNLYGHALAYGALFQGSWNFQFR